ncbi:hypothetical protein DCAR_0313240 [Daucus carota subsp. sativus]|uniref:Uncharacterized protein n=1 Tax=Daucus carota subsp. sativus TaxID=79200 RepID=A0A166BWN1_DAUCS|nr:PREDICTED: uncharacterized protein LOC108214873 isoform X1 [Daucus carota subsp. sativus]WOG93952.1 hypothetical protein DCAR_0313240 [Daucus carota subsp. sativus]
MSAQGREPGHNPFKSFKLSIFSDKLSDIIATSFKAFLIIIFILTSVVLVFHSFFGSQTRWWPRYPDTLLNTTTTRPVCVDPSRTENPTNLSHIVFGIGGSTETWSHRQKYSRLWWRVNSTRGFVWLDEQPDPNSTWPENSPPYKVSSDWTKFRFSSSQSAVRIARIVSESFRVGLPDVRWFVMGDDDTVFFVDNLVTVLQKYDHEKMYYIGGNSESVEQNVLHSYGMAFGGGGFAISYPLAAELAKAMDGCLDRYYNFYGSDQRIWACVSEFGVSLTNEPGFHQMDVRGSAYGLLATHPAAPLVTLHHLDHLEPLFPNHTQDESLNTLIQAYQLDPARTLQQSVCYYKNWGGIWSISISWGYTIQIYNSFLLPPDLQTPIQTFKTWRSWANGPFTFNTRPISPDPCEQPIIYFLDWAHEASKRESLTSYKKFGAESPKECKGKVDYRRTVEKILVSAPKMDSQEFAKAPRRQCCEIENFQYGKMKVNVKSCGL